MTSRPGSAQGTCDPPQRARVLLNKSNIQTKFSNVPVYVEKCEKGGIWGTNAQMCNEGMKND